MKGDSNRQNLRAALKLFITKKRRVAVCIVNGDKKLGPTGLTLLQNALHHPQLNGIQHEIFFDEGLFSPVRAAETVVENAEKLICCRFHFEQNSQDVLGIQLADIVAHTCGTMLLDTLGHISKTIVVDEPGDVAPNFYPLPATKENEAALQKVKGLMQTADKNAAIEVLRVAAVDLNITAAMLPEAASMELLKTAATNIDAKQYFEANLLLKSVEDGVIVRTFGIDAIPQQGDIE